MSETVTYGFGPFLLDPARRLLTRAGEPVPLPPKAFDTLLLLVEARDRVVSKEELLRRLWPDTAVEEASLSQQIFIVRKALEEGSEADPIATVPRRGYRFVAAVSETGRIVQHGVRRRNRLIAVAALAAMALVAAFGRAAWWRRERSPEPAVVLSVVPPEGLALANSIALSSDGRHLAFTAASDDGVPSIWLRPIGSEEARRLPGTEGALYPFWSPDARSLGFFAGGKLKRVDLDGDTVRVVADAPVPRGGTWGPGDTIVFTPGVAGPLHRVSATGGKAVPLTRLDTANTETEHRWPTFLPAGRHVTFMARINAASDRQRIAIVDMNAEPPVHRTLTSASSPGLYSAGHLLFVRGRTLLAQPLDLARLQLTGTPAALRTDVWRNWGYDGLQGCSAAASAMIACRTGESETRLTWVDRNGRREAGPDERRAANPELSPDGGLLAFAYSDDQLGHDLLVVRDLVRGTRRILTGSAENVEQQVWSPDGRRIVFASERPGLYDLYVTDASGSSPAELLFRNAVWKMPEDWSRDGKWVLYMETDPREGSRLQAFSMPHRKPFPVASSAPRSGGARFSPNGRWIAFKSVERGQADIFLMPFPITGPATKVTQTGGSEPRWRADAASSTTSVRTAASWSWP